jgi:hypothetical protein
MRERSLLYLFLALNVALAGAFVVYLILSNSGQPSVVSTTFPSSSKTNLATNAPLAVATPDPPKTNLPVLVTTLETTSAPPALTTQSEPKPAFTSKKFNWEQIEAQDYVKYIDSLRAVGCPEEKVRYIILADINELCAKKRLKEAVAHDIQWWHAEPDSVPVNILHEKGRELEEQRRRLIEKLLGPEAVDNEKGESLLWSSVQLSGPVLGALSPELHGQVQEICAQAKERNNTVMFARANQGQPLNAVELAKMREQTRVDLRQVLNAEELEEFLLRYSQNALLLRAELRGLEPTAEEFRKIFRALDPIDHKMQLEYGSKDALSEKQKERYERQRDDIIKEALGSQRFEAYLMTKDPLYRQAQMFALQYNAPSKAIMPIYQMTKATETKRQKILNDPALTPQEKSDEINAIYQQQQKSIQQIASDANGQQAP